MTFVILLWVLAFIIIGSQFVKTNKEFREQITIPLEQSKRPPIGESEWKKLANLAAELKMTAEEFEAQKSICQRTLEFYELSLADSQKYANESAHKTWELIQHHAEHKCKHRI